METAAYLKRLVWFFITPVFPYIRSFLTFFGIVHHEGRQDFLLGCLAPGRTVEDFRVYLETHKFSNHFVAWIDDGEVLGLRRRENFTYQYHLRVFNDGEVRGHYELTPESHPYGHFFEKVFEPRNKDFFSFLGDWIV